MKTKKVNVEIEIPVDMEVEYIKTIESGQTYVGDRVMMSGPCSFISLKKGEPRELKLRECIGRDYINKGEYFTDVNHTSPRSWNQSHTKYDQFWVEDNTIVWELVDEC